MSAESGVSLVIIDDNPGSLELLSSALAHEGLNIFTAQDPEEGIEIVYREHPQIVLTDLVMPGITGLEVLERVVEFDPSIDVVLMTAHYSSESAVEAIRKGASDYLEINRFPSRCCGSGLRSSSTKRGGGNACWRPTAACATKPGSRA